MLRQVHALCRQHNARRADVIRLRVGAFCGADPRLLRSAYELATEGAEPGPPARLMITEVPLEAGCDTCGHVFRVDRFQFDCPACGSTGTQVVRGEELLLESVTVEQAESGAATAASEADPT